MGAFNVLTVATRCPTCGEQVELRLQFKYGDSWQLEYRLGDELRWGGNETGRPGARRVLLDAASESCPNCGADGDFEILVEDNRLESFRPQGAPATREFVTRHESFIALDPAEETRVPSGQSPVREPPRAGADLECHLACRQLTAASLTDSLEVFGNHGFALVSTESLQLYGQDPIEPVRVANSGELNEIVETLKSAEFSTCYARLRGNLGGETIRLHLHLSFDDLVLTVSTRENNILVPEPVERHVDRSRLWRFAALCRDLASQAGAELAYLDTEMVNTDEMRLDVARAAGAEPPEEVFSEESLETLAEWYENLYLTRWERASER